MSYQKPVTTTSKNTKEEFDTVTNRVAIALAKRESLIKSWTASSSRPQPSMKSQAELEAEDAALFRNEPAYLGVGAPIPSHYLVSEAERNNKSLRAKFFPTKGLKASKARDIEEKSFSAKRALNNESSEEENGRSALGRAKKIKRKATMQEVAEHNEAAEHKKEGSDLDTGNQTINLGSDVPKGLTLRGNSTVDAEYANDNSSEGSPVKDKTISRLKQPSDQGEANRLAREVTSKDRKKMRKREKRKQRRAQEALVSKV